MSDYDDLDLEFGLDDEDLDMDELGLDEDAEFGDDDGPDPDDDMEDVRAVSDDPSDPEDDSGPDVNDDQFGILGITAAAIALPSMIAAAPLAAGGIAAGAGGLAAGGMIVARRARYTRQQRIYRNRYKRALKRVDRKRGGAGVRRRLRKTYLRMKRLWAKLSPRRRTGLKNPAATRKAVRKALGPLPPLMGARSEEDRGGLASSGGPVYPRAGIAAGLIRPGGGGGSYPQAPGLPPLSEFQRQEIAQQSVATNYAQRFSAPPVRESYTLGLPPFAPPEPQPAPQSMGTPLDTLNGFTNERLQRISEGGGMGVYASPVMRVRARQILRSRGALASAPVIAAGGRPLVGPAAPGSSVTPSTYFPGQKRESIPGPTPFRRPLAQALSARQTLPVQTPGLLSGPFRSALQPGVTEAPRTVIPRPTLPAAPFRPQIQRPGLPAGPLQPAIQRPSFDPRIPGASKVQSGPVSGPLRSLMASKTPAAPLAFPSLSPPAATARPSIGMKVSTGPIRIGPLSSRMGFDNYGQEAPAVVAPPDGYTVVPDFTTLGLSAIKEHPIKTVVSVAGLLAAGVFLVKPAVSLIRKASN